MLEQHWDFSAVMEIYICSVQHMCLLGTWKVAGATEELDFPSDLILPN